MRRRPWRRNDWPTSWMKWSLMRLADVLGDLTPERAAQALSQMKDAEEVIPLLGHPDQSAGGLMTTWFVALRRHTTASQAIDFLRQVGCASRRPTISTWSIARGG